jgi:predicted DNA-binding transcriptional regulator YafY
VDIIHAAISNNVMIRFQYAKWTVEKELELKKEGEYYEVSPWALSWDNENYYLLAFDEHEKIIKHYRVDKMMKLSLNEDARQGGEAFAQVNMASYSSKMFGMYHGDDETVKIRFSNDLVGVVIDRFGKDVSLRPEGKEHFVVAVNVAVSMQFIAWVIGLGEGAKILSPKHVVTQMKETIEKLSEIYEL